MPRQLILAAGATPVRLTGAWSGETGREASDLIGAADAVATRVLETVLAGEHDRLDGLVVCNDSMAHLRIFYVLRVLASRGRFPFPVHLLDTPRGDGEHRNRFVARQYERLTKFATACTGTSIDATALTEASAREARLGQTLSLVRSRRRERTLTGAAALHCYAAAGNRSPEDAVAEIQTILSNPAAFNASSGASTVDLQLALPVFMTGSSHPDPTVYEALEQAGYLVVGEDQDTGDDTWIGDPVSAAESNTSRDSLKDIVHRLAKSHARRAPAAARSLSSERAQHLLEAVEQSGAGGVVALVRDLDDGPIWDLPGQREAMTSSRRWLAAVVRIPSDGIREATGALITQLKNREALS